MNDLAPAQTSLDERVADLEVMVKWLTGEMMLLSGRLMQATQVEEILRRAREECLFAMA